MRQKTKCIRTIVASDNLATTLLFNSKGFLLSSG